MDLTDLKQRRDDAIFDALTAANAVRECAEKGLSDLPARVADLDNLACEARRMTGKVATIERWQKYGARPEAGSAFRNLVARIDRDGGHRQEGESIAETLDRASAEVSRMLARLDVLAQYERARREHEAAKHDPLRADSASTGRALYLAECALKDLVDAAERDQ